MYVDFSGFQSYYPDTFKPGHVPDHNNLIPLPNQGSNSSSQSNGSVSRPSRPSRPSVDTYEPSAKFERPDSVTFTVPDRIGYIDFSQNGLVWKDVTENVGKSYTVSFKPPEKTVLNPYDFYTDDPNRMHLTDRNPEELNERKPLHDFLRQDGDTLVQAALHLVSKGAITSERCERDLEKFAADTLDFFTGGKYTHEDVETLKGQLHQVVQELAEQLKADEDMDFHNLDIQKVTTKLTIGGVETTATELFRLQKVGRIFEEECGIYCGSLICSDYGKTGVAYAAAKKAAATSGELGKMFGATIDRLFETYRKDFIKETTDTVENQFGEKHYGKYHDSLKAGQEILDAYASIDFGDPSSMEQAHKKAQKIEQEHFDRFGIPNNYPFDRDIESIEKYSEWVYSQIFG